MNLILKREDAYSEARLSVELRLTAMSHSRVWPNHHSQAILGTKFYRWVMWIDGDEAVRNRIRRVVYKLHPTFERGEASSEDASDHFRIDAKGWGSFYIRVLITYAEGFTEELPYFLDVHQFYRHNSPDYMKRIPKLHLTESEIIKYYKQGVRDFSNMVLVASVEADSLSQASLVGANFLNAKLAGIRLVGCNLAMANLQSADLTGADFCGANLTATRLTNAILDGAIIYGVNRTNWIVDGARASHVYIDARSKKRVPYGRDFGSQEFVDWLSALRDFEHLVAPSSPKVFISYSWSDEEIVLAVDEWLRQHGVDVLLDKREFVAGQDLYEEMIETMAQADKVIIFYSSNSKDRPYTKLERRMAQELEVRTREKGGEQAFMVYFHLDDEPAPLDAAHRIAIRARGTLFEDACRLLLNSIHNRGNEIPPVDLSKWKDRKL